VNSYEIINYIAKSKKRTPVKVYLKGDIRSLNLEEKEYYGTSNAGILFCEYEEFQTLLKEKGQFIKSYKLESISRNQAIPLADLNKYNARIEPYAIIREHVEIGDNAVIMMGAVINIGAQIGEKTMIDMNAVVGGRAIIGKNCHIGAGAVIAGVIEPASAKPVKIGDNVLVGANAVILEGITVGNNVVIGAGSVVLSNVPDNAVVAGVPAKKIKVKDKTTAKKTQIVKDLRKL